MPERSKDVRRLRWVGMWMALAVASFHAAYLVPGAGILMVGFLYALVRLGDAERPRWAFYPALLVGILCYGPHLWFFTGIFGVIAISLWTILSLPVGAFALMARGIRRWPGMPKWAWVLFLPVIWTGLEYFRCELHYLKFAWLTPGIAMGGGGFVDLFGGYGSGFVMMASAALLAGLRVMPLREAVRNSGWQGAGIVFTVLVAMALWMPPLQSVEIVGETTKHVEIVGIQMERASEREILAALDRAVESHPKVDLLVMSEYSLGEPPSEVIRQWCAAHARHLIIGGVKPLSARADGRERFADTAFVIDPNGKVVFSQGKSVPIQFMNDGVAAAEQRVWNSPWGKIGIPICYDMAYTRVLDAFVRNGAQMLIIPAMDVESWGAYQHSLHARLTSVRAVEYHVPIVRVASSGVSQIVTRQGEETARAGFGVREGVVATRIPTWEVPLNVSRVPIDRGLCVGCVGLTACWGAVLVGRWLVGRIARRALPKQHPAAVGVSA